MLVTLAESMPESFGAQLRQRRERQNISLVTIAEQTKIKQSLLEELERDDVSHWPTGIFRRAFIRTYAHAIGLEPDVVVREFLQLYPDPDEFVAAESTAGAGDERAALARDRRCGFGILSVPRWVRCRGFGPRLPRLPPKLSSPRMSSSRLSSLPASSSRIYRPSPPESRAPSAPAPDLLAAAHLCTELGRVDNAGEVAPLLRELSRILGAVGLIVWVWDPPTAQLRPALADGYSDKVLAQLPTVKRDADNATAAAFRSGQTCAVDGTDQDSGALVLPLITPMGCMGVLAVELQHGREQAGTVLALATIFAAQVAGWIGGAQEVATIDRRLA